MGKIDGVVLTPLRVIPMEEGGVFHAIKVNDPGYVDFGEAYFSTIHAGVIKPWKRHFRMTLNLVVINGLVRFVVHDNRPLSPTLGVTAEYRVGLPDNYSRLTIAPGLWMSFQGLGTGTSILLNVADIVHDPTEAERGGKDDFAFDWSIK
jgi:dTDP-4-dehydrorhamnose 3,5-epimerase